RLWLGRNTRVGAWLIRSRNLFVRHAAHVAVKRRPLLPDVREWYLMPYNSWENRVAVLKFVQTIPLGPSDPGYGIVADTAAVLPKFANTPALVCWGMKDFVFSHEFLEEWERRLPNAQIHRFDDCGHYILEDAADEVIPLVDQFLTR